MIIALFLFIIFQIFWLIEIIYQIRKSKKMNDEIRKEIEMTKQ